MDTYFFLNGRNESKCYFSADELDKARNILITCFCFSQGSTTQALPKILNPLRNHNKFKNGILVKMEFLEFEE